MLIPVQPINPIHNENTLHEDLIKCDDSFCFFINKYLMHIVIAPEKQKKYVFISMMMYCLHFNTLPCNTLAYRK